ncbi:MAG: HAD family phosphatase [Rhodospirillales bacterium]|nr:HAD family phosphatase [Rhodospirillales bacterium]
MTLKPPTIVIFDMDGTTVRHIQPWVLNLLEFLDDVSYKIGTFITKISGFRTKDPFTGVVNRGERKKQRLLVQRAIHFLRRKDVEQIVEPCPLIYEVLEVFQSRHIPMGIASNGLGKGYGHDILTKFDLDKYFAATVFREDIERGKPHPEALLRVAHKLGTQPSARDVIWYIGDRWKDIQAALAADKFLPCPVIPFAYGPNATLQAFIDGKLKPEQRLMSYEDLLRLMRKLPAKK